MVNLKASRNSEAGVRSSKEDTERGIRFNEDMVKAGILKAADGLKPSRFGKRGSLGATRKPSVTDGPVRRNQGARRGLLALGSESMDEALEWAQAARPQCRARNPVSSSGNSGRRKTWAKSSRRSCRRE